MPDMTSSLQAVHKKPKKAPRAACATSVKELLSKKYFQHLQDTANVVAYYISFDFNTQNLE